MRIELRDSSRRRLGRVIVDPALRPTRVTIASASPAAPSPTEHASAQPADRPPREAFLNWESALDDAGQLRRCVACGCGDMFREKAFPQLTAFVVLLAFAGAIVSALGLATDLPVLILMALVLVLDIAILVFSRRRLVCYRCRSSYHDLPMARYHRRWDRAVADRHPPAPRVPIAPTPPAPLSPPPSADTAEEKGYFAS